MFSCNIGNVDSWGLGIVGWEWEGEGDGNTSKGSMIST